MLVLSRKSKEQIMIGHEIRVTVISIGGSHVRLGIEAPADVAVHRQEVYDALRRPPPGTGIQDERSDQV